MEWIVFSIALTAIALLLSIPAAFLSVRNAIRVQELQQAFRASKPLQAESFDSRLNELADVVSLLANRVKMMKVRNATTHTDRDKGGEPDAKSDPEAWRAWMNAQLGKPKRQSA